jgi:hypothetical protein
MIADPLRWTVGAVHGHIEILTIESSGRSRRRYTIRYDCCGSVMPITHAKLYDYVRNLDTRCKACRKAAQLPRRVTVAMVKEVALAVARLNPAQALADVVRALRQIPPEPYAPVVAWPRPDSLRGQLPGVWGAPL